jgi:hypothetical protein
MNARPVRQAIVDLVGREIAKATGAARGLTDVMEMESEPRDATRGRESPLLIDATPSPAPVAAAPG